MLNLIMFSFFSSFFSWFAVHTVSMNNSNHLISSDNKGYASYLFEQDMNDGAPMGQVPYSSQGRIQDFFKKEETSKLGLTKVWHLWEQGVSEGDVPLRSGGKCKVNSHNLMHSFCLRCPHKVRHPISAQNRVDACPLRLPSKSACGLYICKEVYDSSFKTQVVLCTRGG